MSCRRLAPTVEAHHVNVRVIAATNRNLREMITQGTFRERPVLSNERHPPGRAPLRERREDIPSLVNHFQERYAALNRSPITGVSPRSHEGDGRVSWPGNVRELENVIERLIVTLQGNLIEGRAPTVGNPARRMP